MFGTRNVITLFSEKVLLIFRLISKIKNSITYTYICIHYYGDNMEIQINKGEKQHYTELEAAKLILYGRCMSYNGGKDNKRNAYAVTQEHGLVSLHFDDEAECREFERRLKITVRNVIPRIYPVRLKNVRIYDSDLKKLSELKDEETSYPQIIHMLLDFYESNQP